MSVDYNLNKLSLILVCVEDAFSVPINISDSNQTRGVSDAFWVPVTFKIYRTHVRMIYVFIMIFITVSVPDVARTS